MSDIADFYFQKIPDHAGRYLVDIWAQSDEWLEKTHDYIQWMFPTREPSFVNSKAPLLTDEIVQEFQTDPHLISQVRTSLNRMIRFFEMDAENPWWVTKNNHNYLRCTRILHCLRDFGMISELSDFYSNLLTIADNNREVISGLTMGYWEDAFHGEQDYLIEVTIKTKISATRSVDVRASSLEEAIDLATSEVEDNIAEYGIGSRQYVMSDMKIEILSIDAEESS